MDPQSINIETSVTKFLNSGRVNGVEPADLASACDRWVSTEAAKSLRSGLKRAERFARRAEGSPAPLPLTAARVLARLYHMNNRYAEAETQYLSARRMARGDKTTRAKIDRALVDVYMYLGRPTESFRRARLALKAFASLGSEADIAMTRVNYANVLHRQDRHREAERLYGQAAEFFLERKNEVAVARCYYNRANTLTQLFDLDEAERLYRKSERLYLQHDHKIDANDARYGLAWLAMLRGDFHHALIDLAACEATYRAGGQKRGEALCELDRAEVYLGLNLLEDTLDAARRAERQFRKMGLAYEAAKAALFQSHAATALNRPQLARRALKRSREGFATAQNAGFTAALSLQAARLADSDSQRGKALTTARRLFGKAQLPLWEATCDLYHLALSPDHKQARQRLARNGAVRAVPHLYAQWQTALGDRAAQLGHTTRALHHWQRAADRLDTVRAQLPPVELRTGFGRNIASPHARLIETETDQHPQLAAAWTERYKTSGIWAPLASESQADPNRSRVEQSLADLARRVAVLASQISSNTGERSLVPARQQASVRTLQRQIHRQLAELEQSAATSASPDRLMHIVDGFRDASRDCPLIQFHLAGEELTAFVHENGATRVVRWADGRRMMETFLRRWRFYIESEILRQNAESDYHDEQILFEKIGGYLWKPLQIRSTHRRVVIIPDGALSNLPWQALLVDGVRLSDRHQFVLAPSLRHYLKASDVKSDSDAIDIFVAQSGDLPAALEELKVLSKLGRSDARVHSPANRAAWPAEGGARLWHFSGHAEFRRDNPFYSFLVMSDGPMFAADFRLRSVPVDLVVLAACRSGEQVAVPGEESLGLVRSLLEMGARNVIAGHWPVADRSAALWTTTFYEQYFRGDSLADSARAASNKLREQYPSAYHWAAFSVFGTGN